MAGCPTPIARTHRKLEYLVIAIAALLAGVSARPYAGGWNDGSRLATVESLVDRHTLAIDGSIFVNVPNATGLSGSPYSGAERAAFQPGTADKLLIRGHYYSDKSPVPAVLLAVWYQVLQWTTGLVAREKPGLFCYLLTLSSSGLAYVAAVWCAFRFACKAGLPLVMRLGLAGSLAMGTVALAYTQHVNNHSMQLGTTAVLLLGLSELADRLEQRIPVTKLLAGLGCLAGLTYTIDLGSGPVFLICTAGLVLFRFPRLSGAALFAGGTLPCLVLHHGLNYCVGGTFGPANAVPEYLHWPGSPFHEQNMTGGWHHSSLGHFLVYALALLEGKKGFLGHDLPLFLVLPAMVVLTRSRCRNFPEVFCAFACCGGVWLVYAAASTNYSGECCSIRWFVPLLAPGYFVLAQLLSSDITYCKAFLVLTGWGVVLGAIMWWDGPWFGRMQPFYWPIQAGAALTLGFSFWWGSANRSMRRQDDHGAPTSWPEDEEGKAA